MSEEERDLAYYQRRFKATARALELQREAHAKQLERAQKRSETAEAEVARLRRKIVDADREVSRIGYRSADDRNAILVTKIRALLKCESTQDSKGSAFTAGA